MKTQATQEITVKNILSWLSYSHYHIHIASFVVYTNVNFCTYKYFLWKSVNGLMNHLKPIIWINTKQGIHNIWVLMWIPVSFYVSCQYLLVFNFCYVTTNEYDKHHHFWAISTLLSGIALVYNSVVVVWNILKSLEYSRLVAILSDVITMWKTVSNIWREVKNKKMLNKNGYEIQLLSELSIVYLETPKVCCIVQDMPRMV